MELLTKVERDYKQMIGGSVDSAVKRYIQGMGDNNFSANLNELLREAINARILADREKLKEQNQ